MAKKASRDTPDSLTLTAIWADSSSGRKGMPERQDGNGKGRGRHTPWPLGCAAVETDSLPSNVIKDPDDWSTGDEPMTGAQQSYLHTLANEAGEAVPDDLTKAEASKRIDELQERTGRGKSGGR